MPECEQLKTDQLQMTAFTGTTAKTSDREFKFRQTYLSRLLPILNHLEDIARLSCDEERAIQEAIDLIQVRLSEHARAIIADRNSNPRSLRAKAMVVREYAEARSDDIVHEAALSLAQAVLSHLDEDVSIVA